MGSLVAYIEAHLSLISTLVSLVKAGIDTAPALIDKIDAQWALIKQMVSENRDPTQQEWDALNSDIAKYEAILQAPQA